MASSIVRRLEGNTYNQIRYSALRGYEGFYAKTYDKKGYFFLVYFVFLLPR